MNTRANQGGSAIVYGIVSVILALAVVGAVYAVQKRAAGEEIGPMEIAANLGNSDEKESKDTQESNNDSKSNNNEQAEKEAADKKAAQERERAAQQAAEEKKAEEQRQQAAAEAREEREQAAQREQESSDDAESHVAAGQQMPTTGGPSQLPQTGSADYVFGGLALTALIVSIFKYAFSHRYVTGR